MHPRKIAMDTPVGCAAKSGYSSKEADAVIEHGRQSPVEVLAAGRELMKQFKLARLKEAH
jgi:hypothetical protein